MSASGHRTEPRTSVVTPDAVPLVLDTATVGTRALAIVVDLLIVVSGLVLIALAEAALGISGFVPGWFGLALLLVLGFALQFGYPIGFETLTRGRTPGKMLLGLRVVTVEGAPIRLRHAAIRAMLGVVELLGTFGAIAVVTALVTRRGQRLGDLAAGTIVVRESGAGRAADAKQFLPPPGLEDYTARLDVSALDPAGYATVRETVLRLRELPDAVGSGVAGEVAGRLASRVRPGPSPQVPPRVWLVCVAAAVQARRVPHTVVSPAQPNPLAQPDPLAPPVASTVPSTASRWAAPPVQPPRGVGTADPGAATAAMSRPQTPLDPGGFAPPD